MVAAFVSLCLGLTLSQVSAGGDVPADVKFISQRTFKLPFKTPLSPGVRELKLFESRDEGQTWQEAAASLSKNKDGFIYKAESDGPHWFQIVSIDTQGKQNPSDLYESARRPNRVQKLIVQSFKPFVQIKSAQRQGEDIVVAWEIDGVHLDWATFKLEYQIQPSEQWMPAQAAPGPVGQATIQPGNMYAAKVRLSVVNRGGHHAEAIVEVAGKGNPLPQFPAGVNQGGGSSLPPPPPDALPPGDGKIAPPPPTNIGNNFTGGSLKAPPSETDPAPALPQPIARSNWSQDFPAGDVRKSEYVPPAPARQLPPVEYVNTKEITLEYELTKVGPSGVGSVDLWWTRNDGQTWERYADDPEAKGPGRHKRLLPLPVDDGVVGFMLVVRSRAGLGKREPRSGDVPEKRVEIDTTPPRVELWPPMPDRQRPNSLILCWKATDKNLGLHPITLQWAERREGPWFNIAVNIQNSGRQSWQLPETLPVQVYLRVCATDMAGNKGIAETREPQLVDLSEPEGRLIGVTPGPH